MLRHMKHSFMAYQSLTTVIRIAHTMRYDLFALCLPEQHKKLLLKPHG